MVRTRRRYEDIESALVSAIKKFGKQGASVSQIAMEAKINWKTASSIIERLARLGVVELVSQEKKLKIYRWK